MFGSIDSGRILLRHLKNGEEDSRYIRNCSRRYHAQGPSFKDIQSTRATRFRSISTVHGAAPCHLGMMQKKKKRKTQLAKNRKKEKG